MDRCTPKTRNPALRPATLSEPSRDTVDIEYRVRHRDNSYRWVATRAIAVREHLRPHPPAGRVHDRHHPHKAVEEQSATKPFHDKITGLANRALFLIDSPTFSTA